MTVGLASLKKGNWKRESKLLIKRHGYPYTLKVTGSYTDIGNQEVDLGVGEWVWEEVQLETCSQAQTLRSWIPNCQWTYWHLRIPGLLGSSNLKRRPKSTNSFWRIQLLWSQTWRTTLPMSQWFPLLSQVFSPVIVFKPWKYSLLFLFQASLWKLSQLLTLSKIS